MSDYISWNQQTIDTKDESLISSAYDQGYVFVRTGPGIMQQTRSLRINLQEFELTSENRRVMRKTDGLRMEALALPLDSDSYDWRIHKLGKEFYSKKFGDRTFSAAKIRSLVTAQDSNFNQLLRYEWEDNTVGYAIAYKNSKLVHYAYPFYEFESYPANLGMAMMLSAILYGQANQLEYVYLGSVRTARDLYKLQFKGLSYFDGSVWQDDIQQLKEQLRST